MFLCRLEGSKEQLCEGASKRRKKEKGRRDCANVDDSCTTDDQRKNKNLPTNYINLLQATAGATNTFVVRLATTTPWYTLTKWACD